MKTISLAVLAAAAFAIEEYRDVSGAVLPAGMERSEVADELGHDDVLEHLRFRRQGICGLLGALHLTTATVASDARPGRFAGPFSFCRPASTSER